MTALDINRANAELLDAIDGLRGHGHEIVRYRQERGRYTLSGNSTTDEPPENVSAVGAETEPSRCRMDASVQKNRAKTDG